MVRKEWLSAYLHNTDSEKLNILTDGILKYWLNIGIINISDVRASESEVLMTVLDKIGHNHKITQGSDGRWVTRVPDPNNPKGRMIRKKSKEKLIAELIKIYGYLPDNALTFGEVFKQWIEYERELVYAETDPKSPNTIRKYERDYKRFIEGTPLEKAPITITDLELEEQLTKIIKSTKMLDTAFTNVYGYIKHTFHYAVRKRLIASNPVDFLEKNHLKCFSVSTKSSDDEDRTLTIEELNSLRKAVIRQIRRHPKYMPNYAVLLATYTGMRVGELAALHWTDIDGEFIHIDYSEHRNDYADHSELIIGEPKNGKHRKIPMTTEMQELFTSIKALGIESEWIFAHEDGRRHTAHDISCACSRRAKEAGLDGSSIHEIRRTVSSILRTQISREAVANLLGHLPSTNDKFYDYDISTVEQRREALEEMSHSVTLIDFQSYNKKIAKAL